MKEWKELSSQIINRGIRHKTITCKVPKERPSRPVINYVCGVDPAQGNDYTVFSWICRNCGSVNSEAICQRCGKSK